MNKILLTFLFFAFCSTANAAVTRVQVAANSCANTNCTVYIAPVGSGDLLVVTSLIYNPSNPLAVPVVTDDLANSYAQAWHYSDKVQYGYTMNYLANVTNAPTSVTVNLTNGGLSIIMIVVEYSGVITSNPLDASTNCPNCLWNQASTYTSSPVTTTSANELLIGGVFSNGGNGVSFTGTNNWVGFATQSSSGNTLGMQDQGVTSVGTYTNAGTASLGNNVVGMASFKTISAPAVNIPAAAPPLRKFYIDYVNGSDSNRGTQSSPWQHAPGMQCSGAPCSFPTYTHQAGDHFIFKGGVTWPYSVFPMNIANGGSASAGNDYYGVDTGYYDSTHCGNSFCRPVFDGGGAPNEIRNFIVIAWEGPNYITFDNLEMTDYYWAANVPGLGYIVLGTADNILIENSYFHNWSHAPCLSHDASGNCQNGTNDNFSVILGNPNSDGLGDLVDNCIFDGSPNGTDSGDAVYDYPSVIRHSTARNMANGFIVGNRGEVSHNIIGPINYSFSGNHENAIEQEGSGPIMVFDNIIHDTSNEVIFVGNDSPSMPGVFTSYIFNNIIYNATHEPIFLMNQYTTFNAYIYNNTIESSNGFYCINTYGSLPGYTINSGNNLCIAEAGLGVIDPTSITLTHAQAQTAGYLSGWSYLPAESCTDTAVACYDVTPNNFFVPTTGSTTVAAGTNLASASQRLGLPDLTSDLFGNSRPSSSFWDIGAYQFSKSTAAAPTISLTTDNSSYTAAANVVLTAATSAVTGAKITLVAFYNGTALLGLIGPTNVGPGNTYTYNWSGVTAGTYNLTAFAYDNNFHSIISTPINITVTALMYGDINGDGVVNMADAELAAQSAIGSIILSPAQQQAAMVSSTTETKSTVYDAYLIAEYFVRNILKFPVQQ